MKGTAYAKPRRYALACFAGEPHEQFWKESLAGLKVGDYGRRQP